MENTPRPCRDAVDEGFFVYKERGHTFNYHNKECPLLTLKQSGTQEKQRLEARVQKTEGGYRKPEVRNRVCEFVRS